MSVRGFQTQDDLDRAQYDAWVTHQLERIEVWEGNGFDVWDRVKLQRAGVDKGHEMNAFRGPWRLVRPYVTEEMRLWVEEYKQPRYTFAEWQARARDERAREATAQREWHESADYCLSELEMLRTLLARRDELIATARDRGAAWGAICEASGLSRMQAHTVTKDYRSRVAPVPEYVPDMRWIDGELVEVI